MNRRIRAGITVTALVAGSALAGIAASPALAAPKSAPIMTVLTPSSIAAGSTNNNLSFKVQAKQSFTGGSITMTVPGGGGWSVPSGTTVSAQKGTCSSVPGVIATATTFGANNVNCGTNKFFVVIFNTTAPTLSGPYNFAYSFTGSAGSQAGSLTETVGAAAANHLAFVSSAVDNAIAGASLTTGAGANAIKVRIEDAFNNLVNSAASVAIASTPSAGFGGTTPKNAVAGIATFSNLSETVAATGYTLGATSAGLTAATSSAFNVTNAALSMSFGTHPADVVVDGIMSNVVVHVADTYGNPGSGSVSLTMNSNPRGANLGGTLSQALDSSGDATFNDLTLDAAEVGATLKAAFTGLSDVTSSSFDVTLAIVLPVSNAGTYWQTLYGSHGVNWPQWSGIFGPGNYSGSWDCLSGGPGLGQARDTSCWASPDVATTQGYVWTAPDPLTDSRALAYPGSPYGPGIGTWYGSDFDVTVTTGFADTMLTLYVVDWDQTDRAESITVTDTTGTQPVHVTAFNGGAYISAPVQSSEAVVVHFHQDGAWNAVVEGFFLD